MTTDTALALLRDAAGNLYMAYNAFTRNDAIAWEPLKETADRITALLDSGIKDAGDDVVEPTIYTKTFLRGSTMEEHDVVLMHDYDTLLSAYKRACVERGEAVERADFNGAEWARSAEALVITVQRAEKAESELAALRLELARLDGEIPYGN